MHYRPIGLGMSALALTLSLTQQAYAKDVPPLETECGPSGNVGGPVSPENAEPSPGGVDMQSGQFLYTHTDLSAGDPNAPSLIRHFLPIDSYGARKEGSFNNLGHNWDMTLEQSRKQVCYAGTPAEYDYYIEVNVGPRTHTFRADYDATGWADFIPLSGGEFKWLDYTTSGGRKYALHTNDGTVYEFEAISASVAATAKVKKITQADGTIYDFNYSTNLRHVVSNRGYAIGFDYTTSGTETVVSKACLINLAYHTLPSSGSACPSGVKSATYGYSSGDLTSYTDQAGVATTIDLVGQQRLYRPGQSTPYLTNNLGTGSNSTKIVSQTFDDGRTYSYAWTLQTGGYSGGSPQVLQSTYTDADSKTVTYKYGEFQRQGDTTKYTTPGPIEVTDQLGRKTIYNYSSCVTWGGCDPNQLYYVQDPLGNRRTYSYGNYGNVTEVKRTERTGTSLPDLVETRTYYSTCNTSAPACMAKPQTVVDPNGNTTTYNYSYTHGGVTIETKPTVGGVIPKSETGYTEQFAWVSNGSGGYTKETAGIWLPAWTKECRTTAYNPSNDTCAGGATDLVTTVFDYGSDSGPRNLWLKGMTVSDGTQTLRTCFKYDPYGNRIAETKPEAGLTSCS